VLVAKPKVKDLEFVIELVAAGKVRLVNDRQYSLEQTAEAKQ
jgi:NADPH:quinone reductase-like Zn-dependent oxidoreductase